jgi:hypothetical protein
MGARVEHERASRPARSAFRIRLIHVGKKETVCGNLSQTVHDAIRPDKPDVFFNLLF